MGPFEAFRLYRFANRIISLWNQTTTGGRMAGWKSWAAGLGTIFTGLGIAAAGVHDNFNIETITKGVQTVFGGLAIL